MQLSPVGEPAWLDSSDVSGHRRACAQGRRGPTTPGTFLAEPAKAEEMYSPETFGRSSGQTVLVE